MTHDGGLKIKQPKLPNTLLLSLYNRWLTCVTYDSTNIYNTYFINK